MATREETSAADARAGGSWREVLPAFFRLGLTSFGGPVAHLGYFREEFVHRRRWLDDKSYADLVALCQFLPGPASSQVGLAVGLLRGGYAGALAAWVGFTLPSAVAMVLFGYGIGALLLRGGEEIAPAALPLRVSRVLGALLLAVFFVLLIGLPLLAAAIPSQALKEFDAFYRAGSLVFGGGHVVLPLLQASVVPPGWVDNDAFLAGYGGAQAVPRTVVHLRRLSRHGDGPAAEWLDRGVDLPHRDFPAVVPPRHRRPAILGTVAAAAGGASVAARGQCRGGGLAARGALSAGMDCGYHRRRRLCAGGRGVSAAVHVADAAVAGGDSERRGRRVDIAALVSRFRSSHHCAAVSFANFGIEGHSQLIDLAWLWFRSPHFGLAAKMMRTSEPPH
jgi:chromate transport protein ChrA